jgi:DNA modification methylase
MVLHGYSENELKKLDDNSVDLIITSPPYADRRKNTYGGIAEDIIKTKEIMKPFKNPQPPTNLFILGTTEMRQSMIPYSIADVSTLKMTSA